MSSLSRLHSCGTLLPSPPCCSPLLWSFNEILDMFVNRMRLIAFYQQADAPHVVVEFGDAGEILHVEINGVPHARVVHQP